MRNWGIHETYGKENIFGIFVLFRFFRQKEINTYKWKCRYKWLTLCRLLPQACFVQWPPQVGSCPCVANMLPIGVPFLVALLEGCWNWFAGSHGSGSYCVGCRCLGFATHLHVLLVDVMGKLMVPPLSWGWDCATIILLWWMTVVMQVKPLGSTMY